MNYKLISYLIILTLIISISAFAGDALYIGSFSPKNEISANFFINLNRTNNFEDNLVLEFSSISFESDQQIIPLSRLNLNSKFEKMNIETNSVILEKEKLIQEASGYILPFNLRLLPIDSPGIYKNDLKIKTIDGKIILEKELLLEINSWALFELAGKNYMQLTHEDLESYKMESNGGVVLKVASNTNWELYGLLDKDDKEVLNRLSLKANTRDENKYTNSNLVKVNTTPRLITKGVSTTADGQYWTEIEIYMQLEDITKIKTGLKELPVKFYLKTQD